MKQNTIVVVVLVVLALMSFVQAVQLNNLKSKIIEGEVGSVSTKTTAYAGTDQKGDAEKAKPTKTSLPTSLDNLPTMVGGC